MSVQISMYLQLPMSLYYIYTKSSLFPLMLGCYGIKLFASNYHSIFANQDQSIVKFYGKAFLF